MVDPLDLAYQRFRIILNTCLSYAINLLITPTKESLSLFLILLIVQQTVFITSKSRINLVMFLLYDHNTKLESEALIASKYYCHISAMRISTLFLKLEWKTGPGRGLSVPTSSFQIIFMRI